MEDTARVQEDLDAVFKETVTRAVTKINVEEAPEKPTMDDENKTFRTRLVAAWMLSNAALAVAIENINGLQDDTTTEGIEEENESLRSKQNIYFAVILYSTFGLSLVRFIGVCALCFAFVGQEYDADGFTFDSVCGTSSGETCSACAGELDEHLYVPNSYVLGHAFFPPLFHGRSRTTSSTPYPIFRYPLASVIPRYRYHLSHDGAYGNIFLLSFFFPFLFS